METSLVDIGIDIKNLRNQSHISQKELSIRAGIERSQLSRIEKGLVSGVQFITIEKIYNSLGLSLIPSKDDKPFALRPFVKWAGGKTQLLDEIIKRMPKTYNTYYEPFVGGGALLFKLQPNNFVINDMNSELISAYRCFAKSSQYKTLIDILNNHERRHSENYYYKIRDLDEKPSFKAMDAIDKAARMIYLNKSCFNGLYRVNSQGHFNVPSGKKKKVNCYDRQNFENINHFFSKAHCKILNEDFAHAVKSAQKGDFIYFDPPYDTLEGKESFTSYNKDAFGKNEQKRLASIFKELDKKGAYVMLSNHNTAFIRDLYRGFKIDIVAAKRMINSDSNGRGCVEEVIITNY